jgi:hypothetical protein
MVRGLRPPRAEVSMNTTSRVLIALGAVTVMAGSALAQAPAQPPQAPPSAVSPAIPPAAPALPPQAPAAPASAQAQPADTLTSSGELVSVDSKASTLAVKTATGSEMTFKYDNDTKISGAAKGVVGLATMAGSQVTIRYKKDGAANLATSIDVKAAQPRP